MATVDRKHGKWFLAFTLVFLATASQAQPPAPATVVLNNFYTVGSGSMTAFSQDGTITKGSSAAAGTDYTQFTYGNAGGGSGYLRLNFDSTSPASTTYWTADPSATTTSAPPANFNHNTAYTWSIVRLKGGATVGDPNGSTGSRLSVRDADGSSTYLTLSSTSSLSTYNTRLNQLLTFDASHFIDPATNSAILTTGANAVGSFSFSFSAYDSTSGRYTGIDLSYTPTPVPEPSYILAATTVAALAWRFRRLRAV